MTEFLNYDDFLNEEERIDEDTVEGYKYRFTFEGKDYVIHQGTEDKTIFGIKGKKKAWKVMTKGKLFDPASNDMDRNEMVKFLQKGIKYFNIRADVGVEEVKESEWAKYFDFEVKNKPGRINKKYVVLKLHCGKAACKWLSKNKA